MCRNRDFVHGPHANAAVRLDSDRAQASTAVPMRHSARMKRSLGDGYELDDDRDRIDLAAVHAYISLQSYWAKGRPLAMQAEMNRAAARLVGLYRDGEQVGFTRTALVGGTLCFGLSPSSHGAASTAVRQATSSASLSAASELSSWSSSGSTLSR